MKAPNGFTLIEVVLSLIIVSIMAAVAGMGIVTGTKGYVLAKENAHIAQKSQLAMARMRRELMELTAIPIKNDTAGWIIFDNPTGRQAIAINEPDDTLRLCQLGDEDSTFVATDGDILVDNVQSFSLNYYKGSVVGWDSTEDIQLLSAIELDLVLNRNTSGDNPVSVATTVHPRNTNNYGGAPATAIPPTASQYNCFVATAAYGNPHHPVVRVLRQFRDRYLMTWAGGRNLVDGYYALGPEMARAIRHRPGVKTAVRWALLPAAGMAYLLLLSPLSLPLMGLSAWWLARRLVYRKGPPGRRRAGIDAQSGNVLVALIITMLIFAALGAGMLSMTSTSMTNQVVSNTTARAYYMAESGFRYAASKYLNATDANNPSGTLEDDRNLILENELHNQEFTLADPREKYRIEVYPFYFTTAVFHAAGATTTLQTKFSGGKPADMVLPNTGRLKIGRQVVSYSAYNESTGDFTLSSPLQDDVPAEIIVRPVARPSGSATLMRLDDLTLTDAAHFPPLNGKVVINGYTYAYRSKNANTLEDLIDAEEPGRNFSESVDTATDVILEPFVRLRAVGMIGAGTDMAARVITYNVPLPTQSVRDTVEFIETFDDADAWNLNEMGTQTIDTVAGDSVLRITGRTFTSGTGSYTSRASLNWASTNLNLTNAQRSTGGFLNYDAQVKFGFTGLPFAGDFSDGNPDSGGGDGFPKYYEAGINFRVNESEDLYGLSFMRGSTFIDPRPDDIFSAIVPEDRLRMIVLWQQIGGTAGADWIAYSDLATVFADFMESGPGGWTAEGTWALEVNTDYNGNNTPVWSDSPGFSYGPNQDVSLISEPFDLSRASGATLFFWQRYDIDPSDTARVEVSSDNGANWSLVPTSSSLPANPFTGNDFTWRKVTADISTAAGSSQVRVRFRLVTDDLNEDFGWQVDDVVVTRNFDLDQATILVRIKEAVPLSFNSGGTSPITRNDIVFQANGAQAAVIADPIISSGSWAGGDAAGVLLLNNIAATDFVNGSLAVVGKGGDLATVAGFDPTVKYNYIQAMYGDLDGEGTPNADPFDDQRRPNPRGADVNWPPDRVSQWSADEDYFTLVQWKPIIKPAVTTADVVPSVGMDYVIVRSNEPGLTTPEPIAVTRPEFGVHASGQSAQNIYFDNFAVQLEFYRGAGVITAVQQ